jgi:3-dehydroquinate dehydratase
MAMDETELARIRARYADEAPDVLAWRVDHVPESWRDARTLIAEVGRLRADRAALLALWVFRNGGEWQVRTESVPPPTFATREEAEEAVLKWASDRKR